MRSGSPTRSAASGERRVERAAPRRVEPAAELGAAAEAVDDAVVGRAGLVHDGARQMALGVSGGVHQLAGEPFEIGRATGSGAPGRHGEQRVDGGGFVDGVGHRRCRRSLRAEQPAVVSRSIRIFRAPTGT
jgi:hypothetical protein